MKRLLTKFKVSFGVGLLVLAVVLVYFLKPAVFGLTQTDLSTTISEKIEQKKPRDFEGKFEIVGNNVYPLISGHRGTVTSTDAEHFEYLGNNLAKDSFHVYHYSTAYLGAEIIADADPATFKPLFVYSDYNKQNVVVFAVDAMHLFHTRCQTRTSYGDSYAWTALKGAVDLNSLKLINPNTIQDVNGTYTVTCSGLEKI